MKLITSIKNSLKKYFHQYIFLNIYRITSSIPTGVVRKLLNVLNGTERKIN